MFTNLGIKLVICRFPESTYHSSAIPYNANKVKKKQTKKNRIFFGTACRLFENLYAKDLIVHMAITKPANEKKIQKPKDREEGKMEGWMR